MAMDTSSEHGSLALLEDGVTVEEMELHAPDGFGHVLFVRSTCDEARRANDPLVILADEPTGALDTKSSIVVREILHDLAHRQNRTIIAVTHDPDFPSAADRQIHIVDGRLTDNDGWRAEH